MGRQAYGVKGITLEEGDEVVGADVVEKGNTILTVTENGYGKRTEEAEYRLQGRGGKGIIDIKTTERNGKVVGLVQVTDGDEVMLVTNGGMLIRMRVKEISVIGRNTQGVRLIRLEEEEKVVALERMAEKEEGEREVSPEVVAARAEQQAEPLAAEDLGDEAGADEGDGQDDEDEEDEDGGESGGEES
jgi:DNA gyrase subunit A